jgi:hypothetical protein
VSAAKFSGDASEQFRRILMTALAVIGAVLVGTVVIGLVGLALKASRRAGFGPWGGIAVITVAAGVGLALWRWRPGRNRADAPRREVVIPRVPGRGKGGPDDAEERPRATERAGVDERDPSVLKLRFNDALEEGRLDDADRILARVRALGGEDRWCDNAAVQISNVRRRA